jgi:hypothetical protein
MLPLTGLFLIDTKSESNRERNPKVLDRIWFLQVLKNCSMARPIHTYWIEMLYLMSYDSYLEEGELPLRGIWGY